MKPARQQFRKSHIIKGGRFMWKEFQEMLAHGRSIIDIVPNINENRRFQGQKEEEILENWKKHFRGRRDPYVITQNPKTGAKALWKELVAVG